MSEFVNTVDLIGSEALMDLFVERSITEFIDDTVTHIGKQGIHGCEKLALLSCPALNLVEDNGCRYLKELTSIEFESEVTIEYFSFYDCDKLTLVKFCSVSSIGVMAFNSCDLLSAVILASEERLSTAAASSIFNGTPIASGSGYIYVPRALLEDYKAATNWSTYATQFRALEDYTVDGTTTGELDESKI